MVGNVVIIGFPPLKLKSNDGGAMGPSMVPTVMMQPFGQLVVEVEVVLGVEVGVGVSIKATSSQSLACANDDDARSTTAMLVNICSFSLGELRQLYRH